MKAVVEGDDLVRAVLVATAPLARQLDGTLVGLRPRVSEEGPPEVGVLGEQARQLQRRLVVEGGTRRDERPGLRGERVHHRGRTMAQAIDRPALDEVEVALADMVGQPGPAALHEDDLRPLGDLHQMFELHHAPFRRVRRASAAVSRRASARAARSLAVARNTVSSPARAPTASGRLASSSARATGGAAAAGVLSTTRVPAGRTESTKPAERAAETRLSPGAGHEARGRALRRHVAPGRLGQAQIAKVARKRGLGHGEPAAAQQPLELGLRADRNGADEAEDGLVAPEGPGVRMFIHRCA